LSGNIRKRVILVIDDDLGFCQTTKDFLGNDGYDVFTAQTGADGLAICARENVDVVLLDQKLPDGSGRDFCPSILEHNDRTKIIFITAYPSFDNAVEAIKAGAHDYLSKPMELDELRLAVKMALRAHELERVEELQSYRDGKESSDTVLIGEHGALAETAKLVDLAASSDAPVLITGETGAGKNVVAKAIHYKGNSGKSAFVGINCATLPENLVEAELFGYEKGAFTGASSARKGVFEMAEGGTLFLDEIGEMPLNLQTKLLSVLEDRQIKRIGGSSMRRVDVRVIAATNLGIENAVREKTFREDLYYRLDVIRIHVPPLRERREDIPGLCRFFLEKSARGRETAIPENEMARLMDYHWPGNVRELKNIVERAVILQDGPFIRPSELLGPAKVGNPSTAVQECVGYGEIRTLKEIEKDHIARAFERLSGNITQTSKALGISLNTLKRKLKDYGISSQGPK